MLLPLPNPWGLDLTLLKSDVNLPHLSGNKYHKLTGYIEAARAQSLNHLITMAGAHSNHLRAFAALAKRQSFRATAIIRGEELSDPQRQSGEMRFAIEQDVRCHFVSRGVFRELRTAPPDKRQILIPEIDWGGLFIPEGGRGKPALSGVAQWAKDADGFDEVWLPVATGATAAGFLTGSRTPRVRGVQVLRNAAEIQETIRTLVPEETHRCTLIDTATHFRFGKPAKELMQIAGDLGKLWRIDLDAEYMARVFYALEAHMRENSLPGRILPPHTFNG